MVVLQCCLLVLVVDWLGFVVQLLEWCPLRRWELAKVEQRKLEVIDSAHTATKALFLSRGTARVLYSLRVQCQSLSFFLDNKRE